ncbi:helix-turn-helix transcriptional regulator [uncultured Thalassospira sp.]|uniref:helix-turn-helix domain-containing protein n=1 Tax=uncultured Thalassospira sp. TaxID=404382 RepID=UPI00338F947F
MIRRLGSFDGPHVIDFHLAQRVKMLRSVLGFKQTDLAAALDVSPQQMQKYETGRDRLKSSHLLSLSCILGVEIDFFFEDVPRAIGKMSGFERGQLMPTALKSHEGFSIVSCCSTFRKIYEILVH